MIAQDTADLVKAAQVRFSEHTRGAVFSGAVPNRGLERRYYPHARAAERLLALRDSFDTQSNESSDTCPSTDKQQVLALSLVEEMKAMGIADAYMDAGRLRLRHGARGPRHSLSSASSPTWTPPRTPPGPTFRPRIVAYDGRGPCATRGAEHIVMQEADFPSLDPKPGQAPDCHRRHHPAGSRRQGGHCRNPHRQPSAFWPRPEPHATLRIGFTPDEEIGRGADRFDLARTSAPSWPTPRTAATLGELEYENFNAAAAKVEFHGRISIHPGSAKGQLVNSQLIAMEFHSLLPVHQRPEGYRGLRGLRPADGHERHRGAEPAALHHSGP